jgi:hypothetical protein
MQNLTVGEQLRILIKRKGKSNGRKKKIRKKIL